MSNEKAASLSADMAAADVEFKLAYGRAELNRRCGRASIDTATLRSIELVWPKPQTHTHIIRARMYALGDTLP
eukprot:5838003-Amphidinium_carterae.1